jgi:hypothetical protein
MAPVRVTGLAEALAELRSIDPKLRRQAAKDIRLAAKPARDAIAKALPSAAPLSGMRHGGRTGWKRPSVGIVVSGKRKSRGGAEEIAAVSIRVRGAAGEMADMAGSGKTLQGMAMVAALGGSPSRWVWPAAEGQLPAITAEVLKTVEDITSRADVALHQYH